MHAARFRQGQNSTDRSQGRGSIKAPRVHVFRFFQQSAQTIRYVSSFQCKLRTRSDGNRVNRERGPIFFYLRRTDNIFAAARIVSTANGNFIYKHTATGMNSEEDANSGVLGEHYEIRFAVFSRARFIDDHRYEIFRCLDLYTNCIYMQK